MNLIFVLPFKSGKKIRHITFVKRVKDIKFFERLKIEAAFTYRVKILW